MSEKNENRHFFSILFHFFHKNLPIFILFCKIFTLFARFSQLFARFSHFFAHFRSFLLIFAGKTHKSRKLRSDCAESEQVFVSKLHSCLMKLWKCHQKSEKVGFLSDKVVKMLSKLDSCPIK